MSNKTDFKVGDKVICVDIDGILDGDRLLKLNDEYEVVELSIGGKLKLKEKKYLYFKDRFKLSESTESKAYEKQSEGFEQIKSPAYYDNSKGSLYQFAENHNLNAYEFDIVKRIVRSRKKGNFKEDLEKTKTLIDLYLLEYEEINRLT